MRWNRRRLRRKDVLRPANVAILALAVAAGLLSYVAMGRTAPVATASQSPAPSPAATPRGLTVAVLGDGTAAGAGIGAGRGFIDVIARERGWVLRNLSAPGAGYASDSRFLTRVPELVGARPDVVVVAGGTQGVPEQDLATAVGTLVDGIRAALPSTRIVLVAPVAAIPGQDVVAATRTLRDAARAARVHFVAPDDVPVTDGVTLPAQSHVQVAADLVDDFALLKI